MTEIFCRASALCDSSAQPNTTVAIRERAIRMSAVMFSKAIN
jgi:hypothetical protein